MAAGDWYIQTGVRLYFNLGSHFFFYRLYHLFGAVRWKMAFVVNACHSYIQTFTLIYWCGNKAWNKTKEKQDRKEKLVGRDLRINP
jgi:hypothetical protein